MRRYATGEAPIAPDQPITPMLSRGPGASLVSGYDLSGQGRAMLSPVFSPAATSLLDACRAGRCDFVQGWRPRRQRFPAAKRCCGEGGSQ